MRDRKQARTEPDPRRGSGVAVLDSERLSSSQKMRLPIFGGRVGKGSSRSNSSMSRSIYKSIKSQIQEAHRRRMSTIWAFRFMIKKFEVVKTGN